MGSSAPAGAGGGAIGWAAVMGGKVMLGWAAMVEDPAAVERVAVRGGGEVGGGGQ